MRFCSLQQQTCLSSSTLVASTSRRRANNRSSSLKARASSEDDDEREPRKSADELDDATREALRLPSKSRDELETAKPVKGNKRFGNVEGGKYGLGDRVDKALDATTNELQFKIGAIVCVTLPILLLIFGPRPPSDY